MTAMSLLRPGVRPGNRSKGRDKSSLSHHLFTHRFLILATGVKGKGCEHIAGLLLPRRRNCDRREGPSPIINPSHAVVSSRGATPTRRTAERAEALVAAITTSNTRPWRQSVHCHGPRMFREEVIWRQVFCPRADNRDTSVRASIRQWPRGPRLWHRLSWRRRNVIWNGKQLWPWRRSTRCKYSATAKLPSQPCLIAWKL